MKRMPLWAAIYFLVMLIIIACGGDTDTYTVDQGKIWTIIGINFLLIVVSIIKKIYDDKF